MLFEQFAEKVRVVVAHHSRNLRDGKVGAFEQITRNLHTQSDQICRGGKSCLSAEDFNVARMAQVLLLGKCGDTDFGVVSVVDHTQGSLKASLSDLRRALRDGQQNFLQRAGKSLLLQEVLLLRMLKESVKGIGNPSVGSGVRSVGHRRKSAVVQQLLDIRACEMHEEIFERFFTVVFVAITVIRREQNDVAAVREP